MAAAAWRSWGTVAKLATMVACPVPLFDLAKDSMYLLGSGRHIPQVMRQSTSCQAKSSGRTTLLTGERQILQLLCLPQKPRLAACRACQGGRPPESGQQRQCRCTMPRSTHLLQRGAAVWGAASSMLR